MFVACKVYRKCYNQIFLQINKNDLKGLFIFIDIAMAMAHTSA